MELFFFSFLFLFFLVLPAVASNLKDKAIGHSKDGKVVKILLLRESEGSLLFDVYLGDKCVAGLFDTGTEVSLLHSEVLKESNIPYKQIR